MTDSQMRQSNLASSKVSLSESLRAQACRWVYGQTFPAQIVMNWDNKSRYTENERHSEVISGPCSLSQVQCLFINIYFSKKRNATNVVGCCLNKGGVIDKNLQDMWCSPSPIKNWWIWLSSLALKWPKSDFLIAPIYPRQRTTDDVQMVKDCTTPIIFKHRQNMMPLTLANQSSL